MVAGADGAAKTFYQNPNFMLGDNVAQKMMIGHFNIYFQTVVHNNAKLVLGANVFCESYVRGNGVRVWDPLDPDHVNAFMAGNLIADIFVTLGRMNEDKSQYSSTWKSITGVMPDSLNVKPEVNELVWYPGCAAISSHWGWNDGMDFSNKRQYVCGGNDEETAKRNVIVMQELQFRYDPREGKYSHVTEDSGHWGTKIYPGCGKIRNGMGSGILHDPSYAQTKTMSLV